MCQIVYNECDVNPCSNGGTCQNHAGSSICTCTSDYTGVFCDDLLPGAKYSHTGAIVGGVIGGLIGIAILVVVVVFVIIFLFQRSSKKDDKQELGKKEKFVMKEQK